MAEDLHYETVEMKPLGKDYDEIEVIPDPPKVKKTKGPLDKKGWRESIKLALHKRYLMLALVVLINFSNTLCWIAYSPVANYVNAFYGEQSAIWFSVVYMFLTIPLSFLTIYIGSFSEVNFILLCSSFPIFLGSLIRFLSSLPGIDRDNRYHIAITGQVLCALSYPFLMFLPTKVSDSWFPKSQRTMATSVGVLSNPVGVMFANLVVPMIVQSSRDVMFLNILLMVLCSCVMLAVAAVLLRGLAREREGHITKAFPMEYVESIKRCITNPTYIIIFFALGGGIGMFNCLYSMMSSLMCPAGHNNDLSGLCAVLMITAGLIGAVFAGYLVDRYRWYKQVLMVTISGTSLFGTIFIWFTRASGTPGYAGLLLCAFSMGFFGLAAYPVGLELAIECTYPAETDVATGYIVLVGQLFSIIFIFIFKIFANPLSFEDVQFGVEACRANATDAINVPQDYSVGIIIMSCISVSPAILIWFIKPKLRRSEAEEEALQRVQHLKKEKLLDMIAAATGTTFTDPDEDF